MVKPVEPLSLTPPSAIISATKVDSFPDPNSDGKAEEGDTITYDVNVSNTGVNDASDVAFNDTIDPNTTLVPGSLKVSPLAFADTYNATKDVALSVPAPGVLSNDTGTPAPTAVPIAGGSTANGGTVTLLSDGSFTYTPPAGFTGADTFNYTATNGLTPDDTATVTINVDEGPSVTTTTPTNGAMNVAGNTNITVNFSEPVNATTSSFSIECPNGSPQAFNLSPSPSASFTLDPVADLPAGQTCTVTVIANQITDVDTFDPPDQMAANYVFSFGVKLEAVDDMHTVTGNVRINTAGSGFSVLSNDSPGVTITAYDATSAKGGDVTMNNVTGTFTYDPPRGFTGTDSFNYTISNGAGSDTGTVVLTVTDMVWFINNAPGACASGCDGRLSHPFTSIAAFDGINGNGATGGGAVIDPEAGDNIFIYTGSGNYTSPLTLENNQRVIGQGATSSITALTGIMLAPDSDPLPSTGGTKPSITSAANGIDLAQNDELYGLAFNDTTGNAINGTSNVGAFLMSDISISNTASAGAGLVLTGGGTATATGTNTINTARATALNVSGTNIGAGGLTFRSISAGNNDANPDPASAIILNSTGASGGLTVTGDGNTSLGGNNSGGTIQNTTSHAISLTDTLSPSFTDMNIQSTAGSGINGTQVTNFTFANGTINNSATGGLDEDSNISFNDSTANANVSGTLSITNSVLTNSTRHGIDIQNPTGTLSSVTISGNTLTSAASTSTSVTNGSAIRLIMLSSTTAVGNVTKATISNNTIANFNQGAGMVIQGGNVNLSGPAGTLGIAGSATDVIAVTGNFMNGGSLGVGNQPDRFVTASVAGKGQGNFNISNNGSAANRIRNIDGVVIETSAFGQVTLTSTISNNFINANNAVGSAGITAGIDQQFAVTDAGSYTATISNNNVQGTDGNGIFAIARNSNGTMDVTIKDNVVAAPATTTAARSGIRVDSGSALGNTKLCLDLHGNTTAGSTAVSTGTTSPGINLRKQGTNAAVNVFGIVGLPTSPAATPAVENYVNSQNTSTSGTFGVGGTALLSATSGFTSCSSAPSAFLMPETGQPQDNFAMANATERNSATAPQSALSIINGDLGLDSVDLLSQTIEAVRSTNASLNATSANAWSNRTAAASDTRLAHTRKARALKAASSSVVLPQPAPSGETVNATIGTLPAGKTVRVQFKVTVNSPLPAGVSQVSNQGTVSGSNFANVLTDDPAAGGSTDPTVTPILTQPDITVKDASVAEPSSGSAPAAFAVTLSHAFSHTVTVNYATANDTGGANPATAGTDYTATSGTLTFNPGETVQTISVPVLADADNSETAETFLVNISGATNGVITDAQAVGTINPNGTPGTVVISELRTSGPAGPDDDFVELANNTDGDITVQASDASTGWALVKSGSACSDTPVIIAVIPNGTVIPARGNYLLTGSAYSLSGYATGDQPLALNIEDDRNVALFTSADLSNIQTGTRLDGVGFGGNTGNNCDLLREGANLQAASGSTSEYSFVRRVVKGETIDAGDNSSDFLVVSTTPGTPVGSNATPTLGAPGPENSTGPRGPVPCNAPGTAKFDRARLDSSAGFGAAPNLVRDTTSDPINNSTYGTIDLRRRFTNNTGGSVTRLRFRIVDMTTTPSPSGTADLRARTSSSTVVTGVNDAVTCNGSAPCNVTVDGTILETPPLQAQGGGVNSTLGAGTITLATPLNNGASANLRFLFGVQQEGDYHIGIVIETVTSGSIGQDIWEMKGNTQTGGHTEGGCNTPPVANAGADQTVECAGGLTPVTLDGSASSDPDGDTPLTYEWREGVTVLGTGVTLGTSLAFGSHTITLKVTDPSGDFSEDTVTVNVVDTSDPLITAPPNVNVSTGPGATTCGTVVTDAQLGTATASDGCSASVTVTRTGVPAGNNFPVGQTIITYTADDGHGHTKSAMQTVTVTDNTAPTLSVPADQTVNAPANSCSANVNPGTATGNDNCSGVTITGTRSDSQPLNAPYPVGVTTITWTAKDASNNTTTGVQTIQVKDATAPVIVLTTNTLTLSPPNHQYQTFTMSQLVASVSDLCDASVDINDVVISQVTSDEPEDAVGSGDGNTLNDIVITPDCKSLQLRSERAGGGDGRVYTITLKVKDSSGNVATAVRKVYVPQSGPVVDSGAHYTVSGCAP